jgi:hypothetical protein
MSYTIERECWNEKTYNGYRDNPYWRVTFDNRIIGLTDGGHIWAIDNKPFVDSTIREKLKVIVSECKININIEKKINLGDLVYVIELEQPFENWTGVVEGIMHDGNYLVSNGNEEVFTINENQLSLVE